MLKKNKGYIAVTSIITLIPMIAGILLWSRLPETIATHFGTGNVPNGWSGKAFTVFGLPLFLLAVHLLCIFCTVYDPKRKNLNERIFKLILLIIPIVSLICGVSIYAYALGWDINVEWIAKLFVGVLFMIIGNYLPKCRQNYTVGIKLPWTLDDKDNWNHTHRIAGWTWILGGLCISVSAFLHLGTGGMILFFVIMVILIGIPMGYSFLYYILHKNR